MSDKSKEIIISKLTRQKVQAAKNFIQQRYAKMLNIQQQKKQHWEKLYNKMEQLGISSSEQQQIKNKISREEAMKLRQQRKKITVADFKPVRIIGKGAFGEVRLCKWLRNNQPVAVKKLKKSQMIFKNKIMQSRQQRNVLVNSQKNSWVVNLKCSFQDIDNLYLVMQYLPGGDLMNLLMKKDIFTHEQAQFYTAQILQALDSVHKLKYIHRDLKPDNVLLDINGHIKLSDFGLCKHIEIKPKRLLDNVKKEQTINFKQLYKFSSKEYKRNRKLAYSAVGTPDYVAPQVQGKLGYTQTVDWWSMGVILFQMLVGYPPFASQNPRQTWMKIQNWKKFLIIPSDAKVSFQAADLIRKLVADQKDRLGTNGVQEIKAHPFFAGINWDTLKQRKSPYIPQVKNQWDTQHFDAYQQTQSWYARESKPIKGYTYKPTQESNSALVNALIDLQNYRQPSVNQLDYLQLQRNQQYNFDLDNRFKKNYQKSERMNKQFFKTTSISSNKKVQQKQKQRNRFLYGDTPEQKQSPMQRFIKQSPKQNNKLSPSNKILQEKKLKMKVLQKKLI